MFVLHLEGSGEKNPSFERIAPVFREKNPSFERIVPGFREKTPALRE